MEELLNDIEEKLKECSDFQDFKGSRFQNVLRELNHVLQQGSDEDSARACKIVIANNILGHLTTLWQESLITGSADVDTVNMIKALIWNCSDKHGEFVKVCVASDHVFQLVIDDLSSLNPDDLDDRWKRNGVRADLGILHNLLRHDPSSPAVLRNIDGLPAVTTFTNSNYPIIQIFALVVLAYCGDSTVTLRDVDCIFLIKVMEAALSSTNHIHTEQGLTLEEILQFICKLIAGNSDRKNLMIQSGLFANLDKLFDKSKFSESEITACVELLWELAVTESSKESLIQQQLIIKAVENCLEGEDTETAIRKECASLSFLLKSSSSSQNKEKKHVMISYQWDSQDTILKLCDYLEECGFEVWIDVKKMKGSLLTSMAEAVENAAIVILGVTEKYGESENTKKEAQYADQKKIPMVPLMLEKGFEPSGWLGILIAGQLYVDLADKPEEKFQAVREQIESLLPDASLCKNR